MLFAMRPTLVTLPLVALLVLLAPAARAARPMVTDDARLTDPPACQLETWVYLRPGSHDFWALPACNPGGNFELTAGGSNNHGDPEANHGSIVVQGKTLFKPLETNGWGIGLAAGYTTKPAETLSGGPYFYVPASFSLADDRVVLHANLGAARLRNIEATRMTWGVGSETAATERLYVIAEAFGLNVGRPSLQAGLRYWLVPGRVQVDTTFGSNLADVHGERWLSIGLRLISPPIF